MKLPYGITADLNVRRLAHCKCCCEPMYCIYDQALRDFCWGCEVDMGIKPKVLQDNAADKPVALLYVGA